jgi:hypothetical protein
LSQLSQALCGCAGWGDLNVRHFIRSIFIRLVSIIIQRARRKSIVPEVGGCGNRETSATLCHRRDRVVGVNWS